MADSARDFGPIVRLDAEAQGVPGKRTFRILIANEVDHAALRIEKEQLQALGLAIEQLLAQTEQNVGQGIVPAGPAPRYPTVEFQVGKLGLGIDERADLFVIVAYTAEAGEDDPADLTAQATRAMMRDLVKQIEEIVSAGRPKCPLCSAPMDPEGHVCVRSNGHFTTSS